MTKTGVILILTAMLLAGGSPTPYGVAAAAPHPCLGYLTADDALLVADSSGNILLEKNTTRPFIPASTLKILTALSALHYLGPRYRFKTAFYLDQAGSLKVKGYGDPLLISEAILKIADRLSEALTGFRDLIIDHSYFAPGIRIPGRGRSTNPYDAPVGALCANFNTVSFHRDDQGHIVSSEVQTPMTRFVRKKLQSMTVKQGRHVCFKDGDDAARYAAELILYFLNTKGIHHTGHIRFGGVTATDTLVYRYRSIFTLEQVLKKMLTFSNNFIANQILIAVGAQVYGPPGTLKKGIRALRAYARQHLSPHRIHIQEGSGLSRGNRLNARDMLRVLRRFKPHRHLLTAEDGLVYKTGTLKGIRTRAGYIERGTGRPFYFVVSLNGGSQKTETLMNCLRRWFRR